MFLALSNRNHKFEVYASETEIYAMHLFPERYFLASISLRPEFTRLQNR